MPKRLPFLKGAVQDAVCINRYLRLAGLAIIRVKPITSADDVTPKGVVYWRVEMDSSREPRKIPNGLGGHREAQALRSGARLPSPNESDAPEKAAQEAQVVRQVDTQDLQIPSDPVDSMIELLVDAIYSGKSSKVSLLHWKNSHCELDVVSEEEWMLYAASQLGSQGFETGFLMVGRGAGVHNDLFEDVMVFASA